MTRPFCKKPLIDRISEKFVETIFFLIPRSGIRQRKGFFFTVCCAILPKIVFYKELYA